MSLRMTLGRAGMLWAAVCVAGCAVDPANIQPGKVKLVEVARSGDQWTGVAVSQEGRTFVNFPRWSDGVEVSVAELLPDGTLRAYPDEQWNAWNESASPEDHFVCVQSVHVDDENFLWILDPASPKFTGVVGGGAKLVKVDLARDDVVRTIHFDASVAPEKSYLNDVRIDTARQTAYITDSGLGAIVVVDLTTGGSRRVLDDHPSTQAEDVTLIIGGQEWLRADGSAPRVHSDGVALEPDGEFLYYQALTGRTMHRIATCWLRDEHLDAEELGRKVQRVAETGPADGLICDGERRIYISALEYDAIRRLSPDGMLLETLIRDPRIAWPDSFAIGPDGSVYFTTSQIHLPPERRGPYRLFRLAPRP